MKKLLFVLLVLGSTSASYAADKIVFEGRVNPKLKVKYFAFYRASRNIPGLCGNSHFAKGNGDGKGFDGVKNIEIETIAKNGSYRAILQIADYEGGICGYEFTGSGFVEHHLASEELQYTWTSWSIQQGDEVVGPTLFKCSLDSTYLSCHFNERGTPSFFRINSERFNRVDFIL